MEKTLKLIALLADGRFHSGEALGAALGMSRAAAWQHLQRLQGLGVRVDSVPGRGYRLAEPLDLLDPARISAVLGEEARALISGIDVLGSTDSTNAWLQAHAAGPAGHGRICLAEHQSAGRGRRGRNWASPFARNLYISLAWDFALGPASLGGLSLAVGVAVAAALADVGAAGLGLKWPNDLFMDGRKAGGILLEVSGELAGTTRAIIGIGLNYRMPPETPIDQPWADLRDALPASPPRSELAGRVIDSLLMALSRFQEQGFTAFEADWHRFDVMLGREVILHTPRSAIRGIARGVDSSGALLLETAAGLERYYGGEVSLRAES